jgi:hypothetical protein
MTAVTVPPGCGVTRRADVIEVEGPMDARNAAM